MAHRQEMVALGIFPPLPSRFLFLASSYSGAEPLPQRLCVSVTLAWRHWGSVWDLCIGS